MNTDKKLEKLVELAKTLPEQEREKLNCVAQGMVLAQFSAERNLAAHQETA